MKKIIYLCICVLIVFSLTACGNPKPSFTFSIPDDVTEVNVTHILSGQVSEGSIRGNDLLLLKEWVSGLQCEQKTFAQGDTPGDTEGSEVYSFTFDGKPDLDFSYIIYGENDCYLLYGDTWHLVSNPSKPPVAAFVEVEPKKELTLEEAANDPVFGNLFPKKIMEGYVIDSSAGIYDEKVLAARLYNETLLDEMVIQIASKEWFYNQNADLKLNTIFHQENNDGTGSYIYVDGGDYIVKYAFSNTDVGSVLDDDRNVSFLDMVKSAEQFGDFLLFERRLYNKNDLSQETLEWLDWYNSLAPETRLATSYIPAELINLDNAEVSNIDSSSLTIDREEEPNIYPPTEIVPGFELDEPAD